MLDIAAHYRMKKFQVIMLGPSLEEKGGMGSVSNLIINTAPDGVQIQHFSTWDGEASINSRANRLKVFIFTLMTFLGKLFLGEVDLVHLHMAERGSALRKSILILLARAFRKPVIIHAHGCEFHLFHANLSPWSKLILNWILQQSTYLIALSESWREFYISTCGLKPEQVILLPNPVEIPEYIPERANSDKLHFVFLGRIGKRKGAFDLLQAFADLAPDCKQQVKLTMAGVGEILEAVNFAKSLNIGQQVTFPGWVNKAQRNELLSQANVFLLPSYNEGLPMALLEAMSWKLPVITTPVGGIPEVITHAETGLLIEPGDVKSLTKAMQSLIENESLRLSLGNAARRRVSPLDVKKYSCSLFSLYCSALRTEKSREAEIEWLKEQLVEVKVVRDNLQQDWEQLREQVGSLQHQIEEQQKALQEVLRQMEKAKDSLPVA
ncbi:glycosyltransferase [Lyngbya aestuarii]|uniref:glycosyltransferase n=1 Tax=Lyngbya aestuarii TaxID=118322 RepID=UPI00403E2F7C